MTDRRWSARGGRPRGPGRYRPSAPSSGRPPGPRTGRGIERWLAGQPRYRLDQLWHGLYRATTPAPAEQTNLPKSTAGRAGRSGGDRPCPAHHRANRSDDGGQGRYPTTKWLWSPCRTASGSRPCSWPTGIARRCASPARPAAPWVAGSAPPARPATGGTCPSARSSSRWWRPAGPCRRQADSMSCSWAWVSPWPTTTGSSRSLHRIIADHRDRGPARHRVNGRSGAADAAPGRGGPPGRPRPLAPRGPGRPAVGAGAAEPPPPDRRAGGGLPAVPGADGPSGLSRVGHDPPTPTTPIVTQTSWPRWPPRGPGPREPDPPQPDSGLADRRHRRPRADPRPSPTDWGPAGGQRHRPRQPGHRHRRGLRPAGRGTSHPVQRRSVERPPAPVRGHVAVPLGSAPGDGPGTIPEDPVQFLGRPRTILLSL